MRVTLPWGYNIRVALSWGSNIKVTLPWGYNVRVALPWCCSTKVTLPWVATKELLCHGVATQSSLFYELEYKVIKVQGQSINDWHRQIGFTSKPLLKHLDLSDRIMPWIDILTIIEFTSMWLASSVCVLNWKKHFNSQINIIFIIIVWFTMEVHSSILVVMFVEVHHHWVASLPSSLSKSDMFVWPSCSIFVFPSPVHSLLFVWEI